MALGDALVEWETTLRDLGAPVDEILLPGISPEQVRMTLGREDVHPDVAAWFGWHDGSRGPWMPIPSGRYLWSLESVIRIQVSIKQVDETTPFPELAANREHLLPLMDNDSNDTLMADLRTGEAYRWEVEEMVPGSPPLLRIGDGLEQVVRIWVDALHGMDVTYDPELSAFQADGSQVRSDLIERGIVIV